MQVHKTRVRLNFHCFSDKIPLYISFDANSKAEMITRYEFHVPFIRGTSLNFLVRTTHYVSIASCFLKNKFSLKPWRRFSRSLWSFLKISSDKSLLNLNSNFHHPLRNLLLHAWDTQYTIFRQVFLYTLEAPSECPSSLILGRNSRKMVRKLNFLRM